MTLPVRRREQATSPSPRASERFRELDELQRRMAELMESAWSAAGGADGLPWVPTVDLEETDDAWMVEAEVPGVRREDVKVDVAGSELVISGEIAERVPTSAQARSRPVEVRSGAPA